MKLQFISEKELEKINLIFALMNQISDSSQENFILKGKSFKNLTQDDCDLIALVINAETYLQNTSKYKLGTIVTKEELQNYFKLLESKDTHPIFKLW